MGGLKLNYQLTKEEIEETLLCLSWKQEGMLKSVNLVILSILGVVVLIAYIRKPEQFFLFFTLFTIILLLFYLRYGPQWQRKKRAERMFQKDSRYQLVIKDSYIEPAGSNRKIRLENGKLKFYISQNMYIIKAGGEVCAVPKRILGREQEETLIRLIRRYQADTVNVVIKKE
ncbi:hypothetical protein C806_03505 [Lachnospiraceae bacterium 3-1]|nr:hypothetical protein C806_03505 [Lachnospiraceae bacterium 3-1]